MKRRFTRILRVSGEYLERCHPVGTTGFMNVFFFQLKLIFLCLRGSMQRMSQCTLHLVCGTACQSFHEKRRHSFASCSGFFICYRLNQKFIVDGTMFGWNIFFCIQATQEKLNQSQEILIHSLRFLSLSLIYIYI